MLEIDIQKKIAGFQLDFNQTFPPGVTAFFGKSGAGKTTLLNLIAGLMSPDHGRIALNQRVLFHSSENINLPPAQRGMGYVFQESRLFPHLNVRKNLVYGYRQISGKPQLLHFDNIVSLLELETLLTRYPKWLSMGEKQRVAIGRALLRQPELLLMDEPLASLDAPRKIQILPYLKRICSELKIPIIYVSHLIDEIIHLAHSIAFIAEGSCLAYGPIVDVLAQHEIQKFYGLEEIGSVLDTQIIAHDLSYDLTLLSHPGGQISVARQHLSLQQSIRVRILPRDVTIATTLPHDSSVLNMLQGTITSMIRISPSHIDLLLDVGSPLWARVTRKSCDLLQLETGKSIYALIKSAAVLP